MNSNFKLLLIALAGLALSNSAAAEELSGETIFQSKCAVCHGAQGEGTKKIKQRLQGERSIGQLAHVIAETMPDDDPGTLKAAEVQAVSKYVYEKFYSSLARERQRPARIELTRLTVRQYRQSLADLIGSFRGPMSWDAGQSGLKGEYYRGKSFRNDGRVLERIDPQVAFDFGTGSPIVEKIEAHEFTLRWRGAVLAPETGDYEFLVKTEHSAKLWVNDQSRPLIDAWVKSGNDTLYKATLPLVAGRSYPIRLEFAKAVHGEKDKKVKDREKNQPPSPPPLKQASIVLMWKRPLGEPETIPARQLSPAAPAESYVCSSAFPPDDRSYGWERGAAVSQAWDEATTDAAIDAAEYVATHLPELAGVRDNAKDRVAKLKMFSRTFTERAFRRPLSNEQAAMLIDKTFDGAADPQAAVKRIVLRALKSPRFLYREFSDAPDPFDVAARLSLGLWDSLPDQELNRAAAAEQLKTKEQLTKQTQRMLGDPRAHAKLLEFLLTWVKADQVRDLAKDAQLYPDFDAATIADLRTSLQLSLERTLWADASDFRELLLSDELFLNGRLAKFYGVDRATDADFAPVKLDPQQRAGVLTHPYLMASFSHTASSSPIHRGVFLARGVLGMALRPPPVAVAPLAPDLHPDLTTRERVSLQTKATECMTCHGIINPLGFTLEHFDAVGRYRTQDHDKPIDSTGTYQPAIGKTVTVNDARELGQFLAGSSEVQAAFVEKMFHHLVQQPILAYGANQQRDLQNSFAASGFNMRQLAVEIMATSALTSRDVAGKTQTALAKP